MIFFERLKAEASTEWRAYTEHRFMTGIADGSLPETVFRQAPWVKVGQRIFRPNEIRDFVQSRNA